MDAKRKEQPEPVEEPPQEDEEEGDADDADDDLPLGHCPVCDAMGVLILDDGEERQCVTCERKWKSAEAYRAVCERAARPAGGNFIDGLSRLWADKFTLVKTVGKVMGSQEWRDVREVLRRAFSGEEE